MREKANTIEIIPLGGRIGALLRGVDACRCDDPNVIFAIRQTLLKYKVIFLREQSLDYEAQLRFAARFGEVTSGHPIFAAPAKKPMAREFDSHTGIRANHWHSDLTFLARPPGFAFLRSVVCPQAGGDTIWSNGAAAYAALPSDLQVFARSLRIIHSNNCDYIDATMFDTRTDYIRQAIEAEHAAVQKHPETGEPYLLLGGFASYVVGYDPQTSRTILGMLQSYAVQPENTIRWRWQQGDLAIWDNLATQHYAVADYGCERRVMERIVIAGGAMQGFDGQPSRTLAPAEAG